MLNWTDASEGRAVKVAVVHEWLSTYAGSERVVEQLLAIYPEAVVHAVVDFVQPADRHFLGGRTPKTTFVQNLPFAKKHFRHYLPLMPTAIEQFDLRGFDVIVSSNHAVAKGVVVGPDQLHVCYVHSPIRYAWDLQHQYLSEAGMKTGLKSLVTRAMLHYLRLWDQAAAARVGAFVANSRYIGRRVWNTYRREAEVIYPPVDVDAFSLQEKKDDFYVAASRMVPYKRMPLIVEAFNKMPDKKLVMIGDGTELAKVKALAGPNVTVMGYQRFSVLKDMMRRAKAFVFAAEEDFGITPVEAMACGTPVIAFGRGGATESVVDGATGLFFSEQSVDSVCEAIERFERERSRFEPSAIRQHAEFFRPERFREEMSAFVDREWQAFQHRGGRSKTMTQDQPRPAAVPAEAAS